MGPVFRAYDPEQDKLVAVKWFRLDLPPERTHRLVAEIERLIASDLAHPAIAAPLSTGIVGACAYLAQDFVASDSMDVLVRQRGPAPAGDTISLAAQLAGALDCAAAADVVHGTLHPRDVLVSPDADDARLTGMGIARALERVGAAVPVRRPYTAPERVAGTPWDRRADIFSLAVLVHEWLWARRVTGIGRQAAEALTELPGADLAALRALFSRALADKPDDRFETALEFAEALKQAFSQASSLKPQASSFKSQVSSRWRPGAGSRPAARDVEREAEREPRLPLDASDAEAVAVGDVVVKSDDPGLSDFDLRAAGSSRYADVETAPIVEPAPRQAERDEPEAAVAVAPLELDTFNVALDRSRSALWPLGLALVLGVSLGFGAGYGVASWQNQSAAETADAGRSASTTAATSGTSAREFTESPVPEPAPAVPVQGPDAPAAVGRAAAPALPAPAAMGRLLVRSTPAGARAFLDGRDIGETPITVRDIAYGTHALRLVRDGYMAAQRRVSLSAARPSQSLAIELAPARRASQARPSPAGVAGGSTAALTVESRPAGASVFLDGKLVGRTPLQVAAEPGEHTVRLERDGYRRWSSSVRVVAGERHRVAASLDR